MRWQSTCSTSALPHILSMRPETDLIALALAEDIGDGDVTTHYFTDPNRRAAAKLWRARLASCWLNVAEEVFRRVDAELWIRKVRKTVCRCRQEALQWNCAGARPLC